MKIFKKLTLLDFAALLMFFGCSYVQSMSCTNVPKPSVRFFDTKMPLSEWPILNTLTTQKEQKSYESAWNPKKTLQENKQSLVNQFMKTCCDFSFKIKTRELTNITVGRLDSGEDIVFSKSGINITARPNSAEILIYNEKEQTKGLKAYASTNIFFNIEPVDLTEQIQEKLKEYISELAEDSVGCELLRIAISKYKGNKELPKITFIPAQNQNIGFAYTSDSSVWRYLKNEYHLDKYKEFYKNSKFIIFSQKWFNSYHSGFFLKMEDDEKNPDFSLNTGIIPNEAVFLHQLIYALNVEETDEPRETQLIENRILYKYFCGNFSKSGDCLIDSKQLNNFLFVDDNVYRTMYGFTKSGLDLVNESSYLAHRYNLIRPMYLGTDTEWKINGRKLSRRESYKLLSTYLRKNGDHDLFWYYLSSKSTVKYPEFGIGNYSCSDINPMEEEQPAKSD